MNLQAYSFGQMAIAVMVVAAVVAIVFVVLKQFGLAVPPFVVTIFWILVALVVGVVAVRLALGM